jgi:hypothetical protein
MSILDHLWRTSRCARGVNLSESRQLAFRYLIPAHNFEEYEPPTPDILVEALKTADPHPYVTLPTNYILGANVCWIW